MERFPGSKHVVSYIGLAPAVNASADKYRLGHISKQGSALLRWVAVRNMVNVGVPERVAMKITGHRNRTIFDRYHIVDPRDMRAALERPRPV